MWVSGLFDGSQWELSLLLMAVAIGFTMATHKKREKKEQQE
jgi:hypothetical protein